MDAKTMKNRREPVGDDGKKSNKRNVFSRTKGMLGRLGEKAGTVAAAAAITTVLGCTPEVTINNIPYDPDSSDGGSNFCYPLTEDCQESTSVVLREADSLAGSNQANVENAVLTLREVNDEGNTKSVVLDLEACGDSAEDGFLPGEETTLTVYNESFGVTVDSVEYDGAGILVRVTVRPDCPVDGLDLDAGVHSGDADTDADGDSDSGG
ncbi:hypothetical protein GF318_00335 [Candidatus Micrarchaeota archaeon]|nr:hypothetical protein [Candidatus Micrarchaeota archaeon]